MTTHDPVKEAKELGRQAGLAAASWVFDGNTDAATYVAFLRGLGDGDAQVLDQYAPPRGWLSGEYSDDPTPGELAYDLGIRCEGDDDFSEDRDGLLLDMCLNAYEEAADDAYWTTLERVALEQTEPPF